MITLLRIGLLLTLCLLARPVVAAPGDLDTTFGTGGQVTTSFSTGIDEGYSVAQQGDGKIVVAGYTETSTGYAFAVARYQADGSLDRGFGGTGKVVTHVGPDQSVGNAVAVQADGKIVVAGYSQTGATQNFAVVRYTSTGELDPTFNGTGMAITPLGVGSSSALAVTVQADGKIVATGFSSGGPSFGIVVVRYTSTGALDTTFDADGIAGTFTGTGNAFAYSVKVQADGKILVGGSADTGSKFDFVLIRYNDDGTLDTSFDSDGIVTTSIGTDADTGRSVAIQNDGKLVLAGFTQSSSNTNIAVARYTTTGALDSSFNGTGVVQASFGVGDDFGITVALQSDGKILVGANAGTATTDVNFGVVRLTSTGALDPSFHGAGYAATPFGTSVEAVGGMVVQHDGRIVVVGSSDNGSGPDFALARYEAFVAADVDGLDPNIAGGTVYATAEQPDGKLIVAGVFTSVLGVPRKNIARLNVDGTLDTTFDPEPNNFVYSVAVQADGKVLLGGFFTTLKPNGAPSATTRNRIARLNADGTLDPSFDPSADAPVYSLVAQADGKVLLGGDFITLQPNGAASPVSRPYIARLKADGTLDPTFNPVPNSTVSGIAVQADGKVLLADISDAKRLNADGSVDLNFTVSANGFVRSFLVQPDGKILLSGSFTTLQPIGEPSPVTRSRIARLNADGSLDSSFDPNANGQVTSMALQADGKIVLGGIFDTLQPNGTPTVTMRKYVARLNSDGTVDANFDPSANGFINSVAVQADGRVVLGGDFTTLQPNGAPSTTSRKYLARLYDDPATQALSTLDPAQVLWTRGGAAPEIGQVAFDVSVDGGTTWTTLGTGSRIGTTANWRLMGFTLPTSGQLRARGATIGGNYTGSAGLIQQVIFFGPATSAVVNSGRPIVVADLPGTTTFATFTTPDIGVSGGRILTSDGRKLDAVFNDQGVVLLHGAQIVPIDPAGGATMGTIAKLNPPTGDAVVATLGHGAGITGTNDRVLMTGLQNGTPIAAARTGQDVPEDPDVTLQSFVTLDGNGTVSFFSARLRPKNPRGKSGVGIFAVGPFPTPAHLLVRTGQTVGGKTVKTIATLIGQAGTLAEGRWRGGPDRLGVRLSFKEDKSQALYLIPASATGPDDWLPIAKTGDDGMPDLTGAKLASFQLPAYAPNATVFDSLLRLDPPTITRKNSRAIFEAQGVSMGGPIALKLLAQTAGPAPALSNFQRFLNTLAGLGRASTIIGNATLPGERSPRGTIFDARQDGVLQPIARLGDTAPGGGRFQRFVSVAKPDGQGYGALISALLKASKPDGISTKNRAALFAMDSGGHLRRVLRTNDQLESAGPGSVRKAVKSFVALTAAPGSVGAARGYSNDGRINALVTFTDRTQAVVQLQVP
jgi:uncharacterized delta-60 repeat protein